jgi:hypothetical protein
MDLVLVFSSVHVCRVWDHIKHSIAMKQIVYIGKGKRSRIEAKAKENEPVAKRRYASASIAIFNLETCGSRARRADSRVRREEADEKRERLECYSQVSEGYCLNLHAQ